MKLFKVVLLFQLISTYTYAQNFNKNYIPKTKIGISGDLFYNQLSIKNSIDGNHNRLSGFLGKVSFSTSIFYQKDLSTKFALTYGLGYSSVGSRQKNLFTEKIERINKYEYINTFFGFGYKPQRRISLFVIPCVNILVNSTGRLWSNTSKQWIRSNDIITSVGEPYGKLPLLNIGARISGNYDIKHIRVSLTYDKMLSSAGQLSAYSPSVINNKFYYHSFRLGVSYFLF